jgi:hypothetical protein
MTKEFLPYELAVKLKQLGFDDECMAYYTISLTEVEHKEDGTTGPFGWKKGEVFFEKRFFKNNSQGIDRSNENWLEVGAPLFQQAFRWFREKYDLHGAVRKRNGNGNIYFEQIFDEDVLQNGPFDTYEEAELACLDKLIEIVEGRES